MKFLARGGDLIQWIRHAGDRFIDLEIAGRLIDLEIVGATL